ncbi:MAG: TIGR02646 family protein [Proteobacteria bacterium]|nr:TIGR02646 family protein [Pseudomonadota bacterium]
MRKAHRPSAPESLAEHGTAWSAEFAKLRAEDASYRFQWKSYQGQRVNQHLLPHLEAMTAGHCAYCDTYPFGTDSHETIDHFLPKARFPWLAYCWENLYLACTMCQSEKEREFDSQVEPATDSSELIRPDEAGYSFQRYFLFNYESGEIEANPAASERDRERAGQALRCFGLNQGTRAQSRKRIVRNFHRATPDERAGIDDWPYRFLFDGLL